MTPAGGGLPRGLRLLLACPLWAACAAGPSLDAALADLVRAEALAGGRVGVVVADAATGAVLVEHAADRGFATASNMKLLSSAVALRTLGPDFKFATELVRRGEVVDGTLEGDLVLRGYGDPTLGQGGADLDGFAAAVRAAGIRRVAGRVVGDGGFLGDEVRGLGWQWDYLEAGYAAPFGGLCMAGNCVTIHVRPQGALAEVEWSPRGGRAPTWSIARGEPGSGAALAVSRRLGSEDIRVTGKLAPDAEEQVLRVAVHDPVAFAAAVLAQRLREDGVVVVEGEAGAGGAAETVLARRESAPLAAIVRPLLTNSDNLYAEQVWRLAARHATGAGGTEAAERHAKEVLAAIGVDPAGMVLADGSGLSRRNLVQPRQIAGLLRWVHGSAIREPFVAGLPVAGETGTLRTRFPEGGRAHGRVRAKTGFISRVVCLSGYVPRPDAGAPPLVFCVMLNDFTCSTDEAKAAVDAFVEVLAAAAGW